MAKKNIFKVLLVLITPIVLSACNSVKQSDFITETGFLRGYSKYYEIDNRYVPIIRKSEEYFNNMNIEGAIESLDDEFTMYNITPEGAKAMVKGKDQVMNAVGNFFSEKKWLGANVYKWGLTDNILVQIEEDFYQTQDGDKESVKTLVVFEHRNGKRWREWRFKPKKY